MAKKKVTKKKPAVKGVAAMEGCRYEVVAIDLTVNCMASEVGGHVNPLGLTLVTAHGTGMTVLLVSTAQSNNVKAFGYCDGLHVVFANGGYYVYPDVDKRLYMAMTEAESIGKFLNTNIKPTFSCWKLG
jgi:hypothetical protein